MYSTSDESSSVAGAAEGTFVSTASSPWPETSIGVLVSAQNSMGEYVDVANHYVGACEPCGYTKTCRACSKKKKHEPCIHAASGKLRCHHDDHRLSVRLGKNERAERASLVELGKLDDTFVSHANNVRTHLQKRAREAVEKGEPRAKKRVAQLYMQFFDACKAITDTTRGPGDSDDTELAELEEELLGLLSSADLLASVRVGL
eukprot:TRINITY_DN14395_c0_g1_i1.p1 TRINITY_DN14395_c0_g1~~TRINITY_DN14395_c0_g1_i1.p1  ORF type:complete len:203 (+),score=21.69 TRINITY_DN14395_c0_g1_i1:29-637(+)